MQISVEGKLIEAAAGVSCAEVLKQALSGKRFKAALACRVRTADTEELLDLSAEVPAGALELAPVTAEEPEGLQLLRHSTSHVMAAAVQKLFPGVKVTIGPSIDSGFYYDFDAPRPFSPDDLEAIEKQMRAIIAENVPFERSVMNKADAVALFRDKGENYKVEIIEGIDADTVSLYRCGDFLDLCRGPHIPATGAVKAFKLLSVAGAYWRGDEKNPMLSRIYGTAFPDEKALKDYLAAIEEAKRRDHRRLGKELGLFSFHEDVAPGMSFWLPKGMMLRTILEDFLVREHLKRGYELVRGPQILRRELWERSGHYDHYRENMYFTEIEGDVHGVKPMNCVGHMLMYGETLHSYRDLPVRMFELGVVHRHEKSGTLHGLLRVRQFTQDDAHIICAIDQLEEEIINVMHLSADLMDLFGFKYRIFISTRPEDSIGSDEAWERATSALIKAVEKEGKPYQINEGDGAFYGPKLDFHLKDSIGRTWQCGTIQLDMLMPERFDMTYIGEDGQKHRPVMVHRACFGSIERFLGIITENYAGAFPVWLAPVQIKFLPISDKHLAYCKDLAKKFKKLGIRVEVDESSEKIGYKIRKAQMEKVPYMAVVGDKEMENGTLGLRDRSKGDLGAKPIDEVVAHIQKLTETREG